MEEGTRRPPTQKKSILLKMVLVLALAVAFLWPAAMNRGPFYFFDTRTYIRSEDAALSQLIHRHTDWTTDDTTAPPPGPAMAAAPDAALHDIGEAHSRSLAEAKRKGIMLGRSLFWGVLLYAGSSSGFWVTLLLQAASVVLLLAICLHAEGVHVWPALAPVCLALCVFSNASFFASFLMPDLYAGLAVVCCAFLLAFPRRLAFIEWITWFIVLSWALLSHDSCVLLCGVMLIAAVAIHLLRRSWRSFYGIPVVCAALLTALVLQSLVAWGIHRVTGEEPLRFPLIEARLIADGTGARYLERHCPQSGFVLCDYVKKFPMSSQDFLFCTRPQCAVYEMADYERRRALSTEQLRFLVAVSKDDPVGVVLNGLRNTLKQLSDFSLGDFIYYPAEKDTMDRTFPPRCWIRFMPAWLIATRGQSDSSPSATPFCCLLRSSICCSASPAVFRAAK
jgi:hypothetical protein